MVFTQLFYNCSKNQAINLFTLDITAHTWSVILRKLIINPPFNLILFLLPNSQYLQNI